MKQVKVISFIVLCLVQLFVPARMIMDSEEKLQSGDEFLFRISPIVPAQANEGLYVNVNYTDLIFVADTNANWKKRQQAYISLEKNSNGLAYIKNISVERPGSDVPYLKSIIRRVRKEDGKKHIYFIIPNNSFYLDKEFVAKLRPTDDLNQDMADQHLVANLAIKNGKGLIKEILLEDQVD
jgi:uncharacterized membrane-anchored protein